MDKYALVVANNARFDTDFDERDEYRGGFNGFKKFIKPYLNKIVQYETYDLKRDGNGNYVKCSHPECQEDGDQFGHFPYDVDTILEVMLSDYDPEGKYRYVVPLKEFCLKYAVMHRGVNALKLGRPVCRGCNAKDMKIVKKRLASY